MADSKISDLSAKTTLAGTEELGIADTGTSKKVTATNLLKTPHTVTGTADQVQFRVQGHSTQTSNIVEIENNAATNLVTVDNSGNVTVNGTVDGRDLATDGTKLDGIEASADVTDETNVKAALDGATISSATVAGTDKVLVQDADDSDNLKTVTAQSIADLGGGGGDVVDDTTPQLGGDLDANAFDIQFDDATGIRDDSDNEQLIFQKTASAVNHIEVTNAATGNAPSIAAVGDDTNVDLTLSAKGTGNINLGNLPFDADQTVGAGQDNYVLTYDNSGGVIALEAAAGGGDTAPVPPFIPNHYYTHIDANGSQNGAIAVTPDRLYAIPIYLPGDTITRIGLEITTAAASTTIRLGIYERDSTNGAGALVLDAGTIDSSTTGGKEITISQTLTGYYILAAICDGSASIRTTASWNRLSNFGADTLSTLADFLYIYKDSQSASHTALADPFPSSPTFSTSTLIPAITVRVV